MICAGQMTQLEEGESAAVEAKESGAAAYLSSELDTLKAESSSLQANIHSADAACDRAVRCCRAQLNYIFTVCKDSKFFGEASVQDGSMLSRAARRPHLQWDSTQYSCLGDACPKKPAIYHEALCTALHGRDPLERIAHRLVASLICC